MVGMNELTSKYLLVVSSLIFLPLLRGGFLLRRDEWTRRRRCSIAVASRSVQKQYRTVGGWKFKDPSGSASVSGWVMAF